MALTASVAVPGVAVAPRPFGLLNSVPTPALPGGWADDGLSREETATGTVVLSTDFTPPHASKTFNGRTYASSSEFFTYYGIQSALFDSDDYEARAKVILEGNETLAVEAHAETYLDTLDAGPLAVGLAATIKGLEDALATNYGGKGLILAHPDQVSDAFAARLILSDGNMIQTPLGTPIAACAGFASATTMFGTGGLTVYQGDVNTYSAPAISAGVPTNDKVALAERVSSMVADYVVKGVVT